MSASQRTFQAAGARRRLKPTARQAIRMGSLAVSDVISNAQAEADAGMRMGMIEPHWSNVQPTDATHFDATAMANINTWATAVESSGRELVLSLGGHYQPGHMTSGPTSSKLVGSTGVVSTNADMIWNASNWAKAQNYIQNGLVPALGGDINRVKAIRLNSLMDGEMLYPSAPSREWFFYGTLPQSGGSNMMPDQFTCPSPGWVTGTSNNGVTTSTQVRAVWQWYDQALVTLIDRLAKFLRNDLGFTGRLVCLCPGKGSQPNAEASLLSGWLPSGHIAAVGASWYDISAKIAALSWGPWWQCTSGADGSGSSPDGANNLSQPADLTTYPTLASFIAAGGSLNYWSAARMHAYLAAVLGMPFTYEQSGYVAGNAAFYTDPSSAGMMAVATAQAAAGGAREFWWAGAQDFTNGHVTLTPLTYWALKNLV